MSLDSTPQHEDLIRRIREDLMDGYDEELEMELEDRSWYNRAGVERVMGFCDDAEYEEFFRTVPEFEKMLARSGIQLIKYWFSITDDEQHSRFLGRIHDPLKQWKLSPVDLESRVRWEDYTKAKEIMLDRTHIPEARWWIVQGVDKKAARLSTCWSKFPTKRSNRKPLSYRRGFAQTTISANRCRQKCSFQSDIELAFAQATGRRASLPLRDPGDACA